MIDSRFASSEDYYDAAPRDATRTRFSLLRAAPSARTTGLLAARGMMFSFLARVTIECTVSAPCSRESGKKEERRGTLLPAHHFVRMAGKSGPERTTRRFFPPPFGDKSPRLPGNRDFSGTAPGRGSLRFSPLFPPSPSAFFSLCFPVIHVCAARTTAACFPVSRSSFQVVGAGRKIWIMAGGFSMGGRTFG